MPCVRLNYEPIVLLATADTCEYEPELHVVMLQNARVTYSDGHSVVTYVDVDASILLASPAVRAQAVRVILERDGRRERLSGTLLRIESGAVRCDLKNDGGDSITVHATGMKVSDWRESTAA